RLVSGWLEGLDRTRFAVHAWHLGQPDAFTRRLAARVPSLSVVDPTDAGALGRRIREKRLHVLIYPEIGMDVPTLRLAAQRLAPLQAVSWGHPVTTALPTIDVFLSSDWMEPPDGGRHTTERLVRLPGLGAAPMDPQPAPRRRGRADLGLPESAPLLLNTQSVFKLMPDADAAYVAIARRCPAAVLVFLAGDGVQGGAGFRRRLAGAFRSAGLDPDAQLRFPGPLSHGDFLDLNAACDIFLDGLGWSGGWTTLEAISTGLVPVCVEGDRMRSRHTAALLRALGAPDLVAPDVDGYVAKVAALVGDPGRRTEVASRLRAGLPQMLSDARADPGLSTWLEHAVAAI
ncbi:MAG: glycosyltransferase, partial [Myxococcota bacterium]|nr:glycosyltransferase [Myxococcota bacterium]